MLYRNTFVATVTMQFFVLAIGEVVIIIIIIVIIKRHVHLVIITCKYLSIAQCFLIQLFSTFGDEHKYNVGLLPTFCMFSHAHFV